MKIHIEIECSPEEARQFMGLPDVQPLHDKMMGEIEGRMRQALSATDPSAFIEGWMPLNRNLQAIWTNLMQAAAAGLDTNEPDASKQRPKRRT